MAQIGTDGAPQYRLLSETTSGCRWLEDILLVHLESVPGFDEILVCYLLLEVEDLPNVPKDVALTLG
jgi:hypothetical protein